MRKTFDFEQNIADKWEAYDLEKELYAMIIYRKGFYGYAIFDGLKAMKKAQEHKDSLTSGAYFTRFFCERACNDFLNQYKRNS